MKNEMLRVLVVAAGFAAASGAGVRADPMHPQTFERQIALTKTPQGCKVSSKIDKLDEIARGDVIRWFVKNECGREMKVSVGNFRPPADRAGTKEPRDKSPFAKGCSLSLVLADGKEGKIECAINGCAIIPRTYKYDILGNGKILLDPDIEIEKP